MKTEVATVPMQQCSICGRQFVSTQGLSGHLRWRHGFKVNKAGQREFHEVRSRYLTDQEVLDLFRTRDESMKQAHDAIVEVSGRTLTLLQEIRDLNERIAALEQS